MMGPINSFTHLFPLFFAINLHHDFYQTCLENPLRVSQFTNRTSRPVIHQCSRCWPPIYTTYIVLGSSIFLPYCLLPTAYCLLPLFKRWFVPVSRIISCHISRRIVSMVRQRIMCNPVHTWIVHCICHPLAC